MLVKQLQTGHHLGCQGRDPILAPASPVCLRQELNSAYLLCPGQKLSTCLSVKNQVAVNIVVKHNDVIFLLYKGYEFLIK